MAHAVNSRANSPANALRDRLDEVETLLPQPNGQNIEQLLQGLDFVEEQFEHFENQGMDLRPEQGRWDGVLSRLSQDPAPFARAARQAGGYAQLRQAHPPAESFWWRLDQVNAQKTRRQAQRMIVSLGSIVGVLLLAYWIMITFFPPSPEAVLSSETLFNVDNFVQKGQYAEALAALEATRDQIGDDAEILVWIGVIHERLGDPEAAQDAFAAAIVSAPDQETLIWVTVGNRRLQVGDIEGATAAAEQALLLEPDKAEAVFLQAGIAEATGNVSLAIELFDRTFQLAEESNAQLAVIARVRMGNLLQSNAGAFPTDAPVNTETPTPSP